MTPDELRHLIEADVTVSFSLALKAFGIGETAGRAALKRDDLPFRVVRCSRVLRVPSVDLLPLLTPETSETPVPAGVHATTRHPDVSGGRHDDQTTIAHIRAVAHP